MKEQNFYKSIAPLIHTTNLFSLSNVTINKKKDGLLISYPNWIYNIVVTITFFGCFIYATGNTSDDLDAASSNSVSQATDLFELYSGVATQTTAMLMISCNSKKFIAFFHRLNTIDKEIHLIGYQMKHSHNKRFIIFGIALVFLEFFVIAIPDYILYIENETIIYLVTSYYPIVPNGLMKVQLINLLYLLCQRFGALNVVLEALKTKLKLESENEQKFFIRRCINQSVKFKLSHTQILATTHNIFNELCDLLSLINFLYGLQLFLAMGSAFAICARQTHASYNTVRHPDTDNVIADVYTNMQWAFVQILEIFTIVIFAENLHGEVEKIVFNVHALNHVEIEDIEFKFEIRDFCAHLSHKQVKLNVCSFFNVDYSLITTMLGAITSYTVIIIQFDIAKEAISNEKEIENSTYLES